MHYPRSCKQQLYRQGWPTAVVSSLPANVAGCGRSAPQILVQDPSQGADIKAHRTLNTAQGTAAASEMQPWEQPFARFKCHSSAPHTRSLHCSAVPAGYYLAAWAMLWASSDLCLVGKLSAEEMAKPACQNLLLFEGWLIAPARLHDPASSHLCGLDTAVHYCDGTRCHAAICQKELEGTAVPSAAPSHLHVPPNSLSLCLFNNHACRTSRLAKGQSVVAVCCTDLGCYMGTRSHLLLSWAYLMAPGLSAWAVVRSSHGWEWPTADCSPQSYTVWCTCDSTVLYSCSLPRQLYWSQYCVLRMIDCLSPGFGYSIGRVAVYIGWHHQIHGALFLQFGCCSGPAGCTFSAKRSVW